MNTLWSKPTKYVIAVGIALFVVFVLYLCRPVIPLLIIAALLAVVAQPMIYLLHKRLAVPHGAAVAIAYLGVIILVPVSLALVIPAIVSAMSYVLTLDYEAIVQGIIASIRSMLVSVQMVRLPIESVNSYIQQIVDELISALNSATPATAPKLPPVDSLFQFISGPVTATFGAATSLLGAVFSNMVLLLFVLAASVNLSLTAHTYRGTLLRAVPEEYRPEIAALLDRIGRVWGGFFRGQLLLMLTIAVMVWLGLFLLGVPGAISLGIIAGLLEFVPNLGPILGLIPAVIVALLQGSTTLPIGHLSVTALVIVVFLVVQQLESNVIVPRVLGDAVDLPPLVVMTGVIAGVEVGGFLGALLAAPMIATGREILRYCYRKILDQDPFPPEEANKRELHTSAGLGQPVKHLALSLTHLWERVREKLTSAK